MQQTHTHGWRVQMKNHIGPQKHGGQCYINEEHEALFREMVDHRAALRNSMTMNEMRDAIYNLKKRQAQEEKSLKRVRPPTPKTVRAICKRRGVKLVKKPSIQTQRRAEVC